MHIYVYPKYKLGVKLVKLRLVVRTLKLKVCAKNAIFVGFYIKRYKGHISGKRVVHQIVNDLEVYYFQRYDQNCGNRYFVTTFTLFFWVLFGQNRGRSSNFSKTTSRFNILKFDAVNSTSAVTDEVTKYSIISKYSETFRHFLKTTFFGSWGP